MNTNLPQNPDEVFTNGNHLYTHKEQRGLLKCEYMWKHHITGKAGVITVYVSTIDALFFFCNLWTKQQPTNWFYMPMTFK